MELTHREIWTALHGMILGAGFLLACAGGLGGLWFIRDGWVTAQGAARGMRWLAVWFWGLAVSAWLTVIVGTWVIYPWYRAKAPSGTAGSELAGYPKLLLLSRPQTAEWHNLGMEWKEHIGWYTPILTTAVAFVILRCRRQVLHDARIRRMLLALFSVAFFCATVAGLFGAMINKAAPTR
jgi:hypothetical protein